MLCPNIFSVVVAAILLSTITDIQGKYLAYRHRPGVNGTVSHKKIVASWEEARQRCEREGAVLATPIDEGLLEYMKSSIGVNNHTSPYFLGMKAVGDSEVVFVSVEGLLIENLPDGAIDMIDHLDITEGDCLSMDHSNIKVVACRARLPYLCYIASATEATMTNTEVTTQATTHIITSTTTQVTTEATTEVTTQATTEATTEVTTQATTEATTEVTTQATTEPTTEMTTQRTTTAVPVDMTGYEYLSTGSYYKVHLEAKAWDVAKSICFSEGSYLAVINDAREAEAVKKFAFSKTRYSYITIGLRDYLKNGEWSSIHGDPINQIYNIWAPTRSRDRYCGSLKKDGKLDDQHCTARYPFICERLLSPYIA